MSYGGKVNSVKTLESHIEFSRELFDEFKFFVYAYTKLGGTRTLTQNAAMHKFFEMMAEALNDAGLDQRQVLKPEIQIPWSPGAVKDGLWKPIQQGMGLGSETKKLGTEDVSKVYEVLNLNISEKFGVHTPFPTKEKS